MRRHACVHGHFYQPPRENPWTGAVERQPSAGRDHDWNARIARECYAPNGEARIVDDKGRIIELLDNYARMSFDFGPTLLSWLERERPDAYARVIEADKESVRRLGHGNAMAQGYHHAILPLAHPRDLLTEIRWGLADFRFRFGRPAEGLWLPECAADDATLAAVASEGVKFTILEPGQAASPVTPGEPYLWKGPGGVSLAVFFYDGLLSRSVAFERAMSDSRAFAARMSAAAPEREGALSLIATDGESYGHHAPFAEMGLAHLLAHALPEAGLGPVNPGWILSRRAPAQEVRLKPGGTSWSCAHGVERWRSDCGCGAEGGRHQRWRAPLRAALEGLRARLAEVFERESAGLIPDPWAARDAYVAVVLDGSEASTARFLAAHAPGAKDAGARARALRLLEMQRHALMMFTSCGWFFEELSRLEPAQVLLYAARALELARGFGAELEPDFVAALKAAPSNVPEFGDGAGVWEKAVKPQALTPEHVAAHYAVSLLFEDKPPEQVLGREAACDRFTRRVEGAVTVAAGRATFTEPLTREAWTRSFFAAVLPAQRVQAYVCAGDLPEGLFERLLADAARGVQTAELPPGRHFLLRDLRPDERERVLNAVLKRRLARWESGARDYLEEALPLLEEFRGLGVPAPAGLSEETRLTLAHALSGLAAKAADGAPGALAEMRSTAARARAAGVEPFSAPVEAPWDRAVRRLLDEAERDWSDASLGDLRLAVEVADEAGLRDWRPEAQTRFFRLWKARKDPSPAARAAAEALGIAV